MATSYVNFWADIANNYDATKAQENTLYFLTDAGEIYKGSQLIANNVNKAKVDATNIAYATCDTAAATVEKIVTIVGNPNWELKEGSIIMVHFTNTNTANNPTLKVENNAAKRVWYNTDLIATSNLSYAGYANRTITYVYDGANYTFQGWTIDNNTDTKVTQAAAITTAGEYPVLLGYSTSTSSVTNTVKKTSTLKYNPNTTILTAPTFQGNLKGIADSAKGLTTAAGSAYIPVYFPDDGDNANKPTACSQPSMIVDLASTSRANIFQERPSPGITGILPLDHGGIGVSTLTNNRILYATTTNGVENFAPSGHYINNTKLAINSTSAPIGSLFVSGESKFDGDIEITETATVGSHVTLQYNETKKALDFIFI